MSTTPACSRPLFDTILIANRGEIACRVIATCRRLGIRSVAVYSEADVQARHVRLADEAWCVGAAPSRESYLRIDAILDAARRSGAQAIHPGYGFLSENEAFAQACEAAGLVFIGPPAEAIRAMGSKSAAKALMERAGVPLVPGYHGDDQNPALLRAQAAAIGYPVLIKASAGGGGKGMRVVEQGEDFDAALVSCQREARSSFGDERVLIERYLQRPRHIEIQVFGDTQGSVVSLFERDCSMQRRHQKVVEEAPAPGLSEPLRERMGRAACEAARAVGYVGAGTVEFIAEGGDPSRFYFMEMNTRLQVEHPVTEMITGLDLVEWQIRVAAGEPLPLAQAEIPLRGHAIEVRVYAEDPHKGFLPSIGRLAHFAPPPASPQLRIDSGVETGDEVTPYYDPMLAKLIAWGDTRDQAIARLLRALGDFRIAGVTTNLAFLARLVGHADFRAGRIDTGLIEREHELLLAAAPAPRGALAAAVLHTLIAVPQRGASPWDLADGWRLNGVLRRRLVFREGEQTHTLELAYAGDGWRLDGEALRLTAHSGADLHYVLGTQQLQAGVVALAERLHVWCGGAQHVLERLDPLAHAGADEAEAGGLIAPMPGKVIAIAAEEGATVERGAPLLVLEAMKMEHTLSAPSRGRVRGYRCALGEQVREGIELVDFEPLA